MIQSPNLDEILWFFNLVSSGFFAVPLLISNCSVLWKSEKGMEAGTLSARTVGAKRPLYQEAHRALWKVWCLGQGEVQAGV